VTQSSELLEFAIPFAIVLVALTIHEAAHAWTADRLGDPTARLLGRVSLNPVVHIDPIGTLLLPLLAAYSGLPIIGWAKPVPVNTSRLRHPQRDFAIIAAAGPISNLLQAFVAAGVMRAILPEGGFFAGAPDSMTVRILYHVVNINVLLALFNLIPVPPLDGGNVLAGLLPPAAANVFIQLRSVGFIILYAMMLTGMISAIIIPPAESLVRFLIL
jgi:Zn-dependent protease